MIDIDKRFRIRSRTHDGAKALRFTPPRCLRRALVNRLLREDR